MDLQSLLQSLKDLPAEALQLLKSACDGLTDISGRSPFPKRQLDDLTLAPTKDDPRPTFFWSAEKPRNAGDLSKTSPYPRLMWSATSGEEITVTSKAAQETYTAQGFILTPPANAAKPDPADEMREMLEGLSERDRTLVLGRAHESRLDQMRDGLLKLSDAERAALMDEFTAAPASDKRKTA